MGTANVTAAVFQSWGYHGLEHGDWGKSSRRGHSYRLRPGGLVSHHPERDHILRVMRVKETPRTLTF